MAQAICRWLIRVGDKAINAISGEWVLGLIANGGTAVLYRSVLVTIPVYAAGALLKAVTEEGAILFSFDESEAARIINETIPWLAAIFAGTYAALYARFSSQWHYLACTYNQMMAAAVERPPIGFSSTKVLRLWQAAFIEDAIDLHLARKPMFAALITAMLEKDTVRENFEKHVPGGRERLRTLEPQLAQILAREAEKAARLLKG